MATPFVLTQAAVRVNGTELTTWTQSVEVTMNAEDVDVTAMGAVSRQYLVGLREDRFNMTFFQDFASGGPHSTLNPLVGGSVFLVEVWANGTTTSATNPKFAGSCRMFGYQPLSGGVADASTFDTEFRIASPSTQITVSTS